MGLPNLNPILAASKSAEASIDSASTQIQQGRSSQQKLMDATASAQLDIGLNNTIIQEQKDSADLATQNARLMIGAITGTDMNQQGEVLTGLVDTLNGAYKQKAQLLQGMQEKQSVGFMDNPLQHILNQFTSMMIFVSTMLPIILSGKRKLILMN
jgi:hypothetical protein